MKRILIALCLLVSLPMFANEWQEIAPKKYITIEKFDTNNAYAYYWLKSLNDGSFSKIKGEKVYYNMAYYVADCNNNKDALISHIVYGMDKKAIDNWNMPDSLIKLNYFDFEPVVPNTYGKTLHKFVCGAYNDSLQYRQIKQQTERDFSDKNNSESSKTNYFSNGSTKIAVLAVQEQPSLDILKEPDFGPYMRELQRKIKRNWDLPRGNESKRVVLLFKIIKDGRLSSITVQKSSGVAEADRAAVSAVQLSAPFRPLPPEYNKNDIDIQFIFDYNVFGVCGRLY